MQCLVEVGRQEYNWMATYIERICQVTDNLARNDVPEVGSQSIEFWTTIAEVEIQREEKQGQMHNFVRTYKDFLLKLLLDGISNVQIEDEDEAEEEWGVNLASGCCLVKVSLLVRNDVLPPVIAFIQQHIESQQWKMRYAALMAFGAVAEGPDKKAFGGILTPSIQKLLMMFQDSSIKVREAIAWVFSQVCTHHSDALACSPE